ncbi:MAG: MarR family transcriptional regulator [Pseudolysinimonas sp.]|uniref:MarR family winged helix-turn-helix transcriptional regulator n=1 Tax=Pseudolysinimonas sp. TaxID=2680009 RepID=UPI003C73B8D1
MLRDVADGHRTTGIELSAPLAAFMRLRRENDLLVAALARDHGLHAPDFRAVAFVRFTPGVTPRGLAEHLALSLSATTAVVDRLVAAGYVLRSPNPDDGRSFRLAVTTAGAEAVEDAIELYTAAFEEVVPADRRDEVAATFVDIADALAAAAAERTPPTHA